MRFFSLALPVFLAGFAAASPVSVEKKDVVARQATPAPAAGLDLVSLLNGLQSDIASQGEVINTDPTDGDLVAGALQTITGLLEDVVGLLADNGADTDPSSIGSGGLLGGLLGGLGGSGGGLLGKRQQDLDSVGTALQGVLTTVQGIVAGLPAATLTIPLVGQLITSLTPLLLSLVAGLNSLVPGLIALVRTLLVTVAGLLLSL